MAPSGVPIAAITAVGLGPTIQTVGAGPLQQSRRQNRPRKGRRIGTAMSQAAAGQQCPRRFAARALGRGRSAPVAASLPQPGPQTIGSLFSTSMQEADGPAARRRRFILASRSGNARGYAGRLRSACVGVFAGRVAAAQAVRRWKSCEACSRAQVSRCCRRHNADRGMPAARLSGVGGAPVAVMERHSDGGAPRISCNWAIEGVVACARRYSLGN